MRKRQPGNDRGGISYEKATQLLLDKSLNHENRSLNRPTAYFHGVFVARGLVLDEDDRSVAPLPEAIQHAPVLPVVAREQLVAPQPVVAAATARPRRARRAV